jgi:ATP-dependent helicase HrpA
MNLRLAERDGRVLAMSRDLDELRRRFGEEAERAFAQRAGEDIARTGLLRFPETPIPVQVTGAAGVPAFPALVDQQDSVALSVFADADEAAREHDAGARRLATLALADKLRQARKQLPVAPKLALLYAAIEGFAQAPGAPPAHEHLRTDLAQAALNAVLSASFGPVRDATAFQQRVDEAARRLFAEAMARLQLAESILGLVADIKPRLESPLLGWASGNLDDLKAQLAGLVPPGFLRDTPADALSEYPRYLKALSLRADRALRDPVRDQARMLELKPFTDAMAAARRSGRFAGPDWQALRWDLEELRVSMFAQELGTRRQVSTKRLARQLDALT